MIKVLPGSLIQRNNMLIVNFQDEPVEQKGLLIMTLSFLIFFPSFILKNAHNKNTKIQFYHARQTTTYIKT